MRNIPNKLVIQKRQLFAFILAPVLIQITACANNSQQKLGGKSLEAWTENASLIPFLTFTKNRFIPKIESDTRELIELSKNRSCTDFISSPLYDLEKHSFIKDSRICCEESQQTIFEFYFDSYYIARKAIELNCANKIHEFINYLNSTSLKKNSALFLYKYELSEGNKKIFDDQMWSEFFKAEGILKIDLNKINLKNIIIIHGKNLDIIKKEISEIETKVKINKQKLK